MSTADSSCVNVGELIRNGLTLPTREAIALVYEGCDRAPGSGKQIRFPLVPDDLWLAPTGEVHVELMDSAKATTDARVAVAALLDALLPPPSDLPEFTVRASLRSLPSRLRESAAAVETAQPRDVLAILKRQLADDPHLMLQQLANRVKAPFPQALSQEARARLDRGIAAHATSRQPLPREHDLDDGRSSGVEETIAEHGLDVAPTAAAVSPTIRLRMLAIVLVAIVASGYAGYIYTGYLLSGSTRVDDPTAAQAVRAGAGGPRLPRDPTVAPIIERTHRRDALPPSVATGTGGTHGSATEQARSLEGGDTAGRDERPRPLILPFSDEAFSPSFAPNGRTLFFHIGRSTGRLLEATFDESGTASRITLVLAHAGSRAASKDYHPRLSPDGRLVAFDSDRDGERGVYVASPVGGDAIRVSGSGFAAVPSWSPDMKWLAFVRAEATRPKVWNLWLRDLASGTLTRQTSFGVGQLWGASWFPDSRRLCYSHENELIIHDLSTGKTETFPTPRRGHLIRTPAVSPDGHRIVFQVHRDGVWMLNLQTRAMSRILDDATAEEFAWDPEGRRIAYHSRRDGEWRIWMTTPPRF